MPTRPPRFALVLLSCVLTWGLLGLPARAAPAAPRELVFDLSGFQPFAVGGEVFGVGSDEGEVVGARLEVRFTSEEEGPWSMAASFVDFPMGGSIGFSSTELGWEGAGTFSTVVVSDALDGTLAVPPGEPFYSWFMVWTGGAPFELPGGGVGVGPVDGVFDVLRLTLTLAGCPDGDPDLPWTDLGGGVSGGQAPVLSPSGSLCPGEEVQLSLTGGPAHGTTTLVLGLSALEAPFKGGVLVPSPDVLVSGLPLDGEGALPLVLAWPLAVPSGLSLWLQHWMPDVTAPAGLSASNGVRGCVP